MSDNKLTEYPQAARVIALYLEEFCDKDLDYINMIAEASRKAAQKITTLRNRLKSIRRLLL